MDCAIDLHKVLETPFLSVPDQPRTLTHLVIMKLITLVTLLGSQLALGSHLLARQQDNCFRNNCYNAVWGTNPDLVPFPNVVACQRHVTTTEIIYPL